MSECECASNNQSVFYFMSVHSKVMLGTHTRQISLNVSVDVKRHVYLLYTSMPPFPPSQINRNVSVDVKHHVYLQGG